MSPFTHVIAIFLHLGINFWLIMKDEILVKKIIEIFPSPYDNSNAKKSEKQLTKLEKIKETLQSQLPQSDDV